MVRHFENRPKAEAYKKSKNSSVLKIYKKVKGHKNRITKPYVVCSYFEWMNLN